MFDSPDHAAQAMQAFFAPQQVQEVVQALVPAIALRPMPAAGQPGASRLGGLPDMPAGAQWPRPPIPDDIDAIAQRGNASAAAEMREHLGKGLPFAFIGQIDLEEASRLGAAAAALPAHGRLLFFHDLAIGPWESGARTVRVIWDETPREALRPLAMPVDLADAAQAEWRALEAVFREYDRAGQGARQQATVYGAQPRPVSLRAMLVAPDPASLESEGLPGLRPGGDADEDFADAYEGMREDLGLSWPAEKWKRHQLLGSPAPEQDDPRYQAVIVTDYRQEFLDRETWKRERDRITQRARDWRLLLQVDLADWSGDVLGEGTVYFLIRGEDLAARRFDRVVAVYQQI